jgi:hypothetical protein
MFNIDTCILLSKVYFYDMYIDNVTHVEFKMMANSLFRIHSNCYLFIYHELDIVHDDAPLWAQSG